MLPTRWLEKSFAVVQVADFPDLTVYVENQPVGRTDERGRVLLDGLRPYESNDVSLDPAELPLDASLAKARVMLTPAWRSGAVVEFPIIRAAGGHAAPGAGGRGAVLPAREFIRPAARRPWRSADWCT